MVDRTHQQVNPLQAAEQLLHDRQPLVRPHARLRRQPLGWLAGANHIDPVQQALLSNRLFIMRQCENIITNRQSDVLGHLVPPDHLTRLHADLRSRPRRLGPQRHVAGQLRQVLLRRGQRRSRFCRRFSANSGLKQAINRSPGKSGDVISARFTWSNNERRMASTHVQETKRPCREGRSRSEPKRSRQLLATRCPPRQPGRSHIMPSVALRR